MELGRLLALGPWVSLAQRSVLPGCCQRPSLQECPVPTSVQRFHPSRLGCRRCPFLLGHPSLGFTSYRLPVPLDSPDLLVLMMIEATWPDCSEEQMPSARPSPHLDHLDHCRLELHPVMRDHSCRPVPYLWPTETGGGPGIISEVDSSPH